MLFASDCMESAMITQQTTTNTKMLSVVFLRIRLLRLCLVSRPWEADAFSAMFLLLFPIT
jgi:hypothetical protein